MLYRHIVSCCVPAALALLWGTAACAQSESSAEARVPPVDIAAYPEPRPFPRRPPIPVRLMPRDIVEPPRDVAAREWKSPYCTEWSDGIEFCTRQRADEPATCQPIPENQRSALPAPHPVACFSADRDRLRVVCWRSVLSDPGVEIPYWRRGNISWGALYQANWLWSNDLTEWLLSIGEDDASIGDPSYLGIHGVEAQLPRIRTLYCVDPYTIGIDWAKMTPGRIVR
jgi:hypothetical protein